MSLSNNENSTVLGNNLRVKFDNDGPRVEPTFNDLELGRRIVNRAQSSLNEVNVEFDNVSIQEPNTHQPTNPKPIRPNN